MSTTATTDGQGVVELEDWAGGPFVTVEHSLEGSGVIACPVADGDTYTGVRFFTASGRPVADTEVTFTIKEDTHA